MVVQTTAFRSLYTPPRNGRQGDQPPPRYLESDPPLAISAHPGSYRAKTCFCSEESAVHVTEGGIPECGMN